MRRSSEDSECLKTTSKESQRGALHFAKIEMVDELQIKFPWINGILKDDAEEQLIYGLTVKLFSSKGKFKECIINTVDEDTLMMIFPHSKKNKIVKVSLMKITDISLNKVSGNFSRLNYYKEIAKINDSLCVTIHYDNNFKYYDLVFKSEKEVHLFIGGIVHFLEKTIEENKVTSTDLISLKKIWKEYDPNHNKYLNLEGFSKFLRMINFQWKKKTYEEIFLEIDSEKLGKIKFKDFISFYELIVTGEEFREIFQKYSTDEDKKYLTMRGLADFMEKEQNEKLSSQDVFNLMLQFSKKTKKLTQMMKLSGIKDLNNLHTYTPHPINSKENDDRESLAVAYENYSFGKNYCAAEINNTELNINENKLKNAFLLSFRDFVNMMVYKSLNTVLNTEYFSIHQNMNLPLNNYFIHSSHNTYLDGNQLNSNCTKEMYYCALKNGCRLVELDCWDGRNGSFDEPIITHWHFPVGELKLKEVLEVIKENAFKKSEYPVLLSVENHCSPKTQLNMEKYFREILGSDNLYCVDPLNPPITYPSPNELKRKFIIKIRRKRIFGEFDNLERKKSSYSDLVSPGKESLPQQSNSFFQEACDISLTNKSSQMISNSDLIKAESNQVSLRLSNTLDRLFKFPENNEEEDLNRNKSLKKSSTLKNIIPTSVIHEEELSSMNENNISEVEEKAMANPILTNRVLKSKFEIQTEENDEDERKKEDIIDNSVNMRNLQRDRTHSRKIEEENFHSFKNNFNEDNKIFPQSEVVDTQININIEQSDKKQIYLKEIELTEENLNFSPVKNCLKTKKKFEESSENLIVSDINIKDINFKTSLINSNQVMSKLKEKIFENEAENKTIGDFQTLGLKAEINRINELKKSDQIPKCNKTIDELASVVGLCGYGYKREDFESSTFKFLPWECISIKEPEFLRHVNNLETKFNIIRICQKSFVKVYPDIMRTDSSNHDPIQCWSAGVQISAMNLQRTDEDWVLINKLFFKINGGSKCGFILKPDILMNPNCDDILKKQYSKPSMKIKFKILSGFHLHYCIPKGIKINGIFVEVTLRGPKIDDVKNHIVLTTETISNNYLHPVWQSNSKHFEIYDPEFSFFIIKLFSNKRNVLARSVIPVKILKMGYRVLDLYDKLCSKFDSSFIIVRTNKIFLN